MHSIAYLKDSYVATLAHSDLQLLLLFEYDLSYPWRLIYTIANQPIAHFSTLHVRELKGFPTSLPHFSHACHLEKN